MAQGQIAEHLETLFQFGAAGDTPDGHLIRRFLDDDEGGKQVAFSQLVERHGPMVLRVCRKVLRDHEDAQDAFQATFLVLARKADSVRKGDSVASWLHGVALRVAMKARRAASRRKDHEGRVGRSRATAMADAHDTDGSWPELHEAIAGLPARYRESVVLCYLEGLTIDSAAHRLGCSPGTICSRLSRAKDRLRSRLRGRELALTALGPAPVGLGVSTGLPRGLVALTMRRSLRFSAGRSARALLTPDPATILARNAMTAMLLGKAKILALALLASGLTLMGLETFGQLGGSERPKPSGIVAPPGGDGGKTADVPRALDSIKADLKEASRENAKAKEVIRSAEEKIEAIQAELRREPDPEKQAASQLFDSLRDDPAKAVSRFVEALKRHPVPRIPNEPDGTQLYMRDLASGETILFADRPEPDFDSCGSPRWSPDGRKIAFDATVSTQLGRARIKMLEVREGRPILTDLGPGNCPNFSPDGKQIAFLINPGVEDIPGAPPLTPGVWVMRADGTERRLVTTEFGAPAWSPNGQGFLIKGFRDPATITIFRSDDLSSAAIAVPNRDIFSWPSWFDDSTIVAPLRARDGGESIAHLDVHNPSHVAVLKVLWTRNAELDVKPYSPVYHRETRTCYFVGLALDGKRWLLAIERDRPEAPIRLEGRAFHDRLGGLTFSPGGRYLLFAADRPPGFAPAPIGILPPPPRAPLAETKPAAASSNPAEEPRQPSPSLISLLTQSPTVGLQPLRKDTFQKARPWQARVTPNAIPKKVSPGETFTYNIKFNLDDGWRIFSTAPEPAPKDGPIFTSFDFFDPAGFEVVGGWQASRPPSLARPSSISSQWATVESYEEEVTWTIRLKVPRDMQPGEKTLRCQARYQLMSADAVKAPGQWTLADVTVRVVP